MRAALLVKEIQAMNRRLTEQRQPTSPMNETAQDVWVDLLAEIVVAAVQREDQNAGS